MVSGFSFLMACTAAPAAWRCWRRYTPKNLDEVRTCLGGCPAEMEVEVERGIPLTANTVAELRVLPAWPPGDWVLDVPVDGDQRYNVVRVEWRSYTSL